MTNSNNNYWVEKQKRLEREKQMQQPLTHKLSQAPVRITEKTDAPAAPQSSGNAANTQPPSRKLAQGERPGIPVITFDEAHQKWLGLVRDGQMRSTAASLRIWTEYNVKTVRGLGNGEVRMYATPGSLQSAFLDNSPEYSTRMTPTIKAAIEAKRIMRGEAPAHSQKMDASFPHPAEYARNNPPPSPAPEHMRHARPEAPAPMPAPQPPQQTMPFVSAADHAEFMAQAMAILNMPGKLSLKKAALRALLDETP